QRFYQFPIGVDANRLVVLQELRRHLRLGYVERAEHVHRRVSRHWNSWGVSPEVEASMLQLAGYDGERLGAHGQELLPSKTHMRNLPSAKRAIEPTEQTHKYGPHAPIVGQGDHSVSVNCWQAEVWRWLSWLKRECQFNGRHI